MMEAAQNLPAASLDRDANASPEAQEGNELTLVQRCAAELRRVLRCSCCIVAVPAGEKPSVFSIECGSAIRKSLKSKMTALLQERGNAIPDADSFLKLRLPGNGNALRVDSPVSQGVRTVLLAFGVKKEKEAEALLRMKKLEEDLRIRLENLRLSRALAQQNSILGGLLKSVSGLTRRAANFTELLQSVSGEARTLLRTEFAAICLPADDPGASAFSVRACAGPVPEDSQQMDALFARALQEYDPSRRKPQVSAGQNGEKLLLVPLIQRGAPQGMMLFCSRDPAFTFTEELLQMAELFSDWVAVVLENATMFERVSASQQEWESTFDSIFDPIYLIDAEYRLKKINKAMASYTMLSIKLPRNQYCYRFLFHRDSLCPWCPVPRSLRTGQAVVVEAPVFSGGIWQIQSYPFTDKSDARTGSINVLRDITLLKRIQEQLIESEKMASTGKLISGVAHEVRNPLFGISTTVRALANELGNKEDLKPFLDIVTSETARLNRLMEELLNYSRPVKIDKNPSDIGELIRDVIGRYQNVPGGKEVSVRLFGAENIPRINMDRNKIHQVLLNLVENGIQHCGDQPRIDIFLEYLSLSYPPEIHIVVKDYGSGINPEILPRIFDPFFTTRSRGTGLGLSIVRKVVHDHGGRIAVESHVGAGTTFRIVLPVSPAES